MVTTGQCYTETHTPLLFVNTRIIVLIEIKEAVCSVNRISFEFISLLSNKKIWEELIRQLFLHKSFKFLNLI
jgi:hypothetical protein